MVDSGASHSYVPLSLVKAMQWTVTDVSSSQVKLPNGNILSTSSIVKLKVNYLPTKCTEVIKFYVLPIDSGLMLGGDWLKGNQY